MIPPETEKGERELLRDALLLAVIESHHEDLVLAAENDADLSFDHLFKRGLADTSGLPSGEYASYATGEGRDLVVEALKLIAREQASRPPEGHRRDG